MSFSLNFLLSSGVIYLRRFAFRISRSVAVSNRKTKRSIAWICRLSAVASLFSGQTAMRRLLLITSLLFGLCSTTHLQSAMVIAGYDPNIHNRFDITAFLGAAFDWSGVGKAGGSWSTMISPTQFFSASHAHPPTS